MEIRDRRFMEAELVTLVSERKRVATQLAELRQSEAEIRLATNDRAHKFDPLASVYYRRQALESYLQQLEADIAGFLLEA